MPATPEKVRNRAFDLIGLARTHLITREPERWVNGGIGAWLRDFHHEAATFATVPDVRDAREAVTALLAA